MAKDKIDELEKKKQELEDELQKIQGEIDNSVSQVRNDVSSNLNPRNIIRKYPLHVVGASALLGFLIGNKGTSSSKESASGEFSGTLLAELKRLATRKAISFATDYVEDLLEEKASEHLSSTNGEGEGES